MKKIPFLMDIIATGFYTGKMPFMPGTFGSIVAIPLGYLGSFLPIPLKVVFFAAIFALGVFTSDKYAKYSGKDDPSCIVIDEIAALLLLYLVFPFKPYYIVCGFLLFRIFDILKPFPVGYFEHFPGGWGIMLDDIMAVIYAGISCWLIKLVLELF